VLALPFFIFCLPSGNAHWGCPLLSLPLVWIARRAISFFSGSGIMDRYFLLQFNQWSILRVFKRPSLLPRNFYHFPKAIQGNDLLTFDPCTESFLPPFSSPSLGFIFSPSLSTSLQQPKKDFPCFLISAFLDWTIPSTCYGKSLSPKVLFNLSTSFWTLVLEGLPILFNLKTSTPLAFDFSPSFPPSSAIFLTPPFQVSLPLIQAHCGMVPTACRFFQI